MAETTKVKLKKGAVFLLLTGETDPSTDRPIRKRVVGPEIIEMTAKQMKTFADMIENSPVKEAAPEPKEPVKEPVKAPAASSSGPSSSGGSSGSGSSGGSGGKS